MVMVMVMVISGIIQVAVVGIYSSQKYQWQQMLLILSSLAFMPFSRALLVDPNNYSLYALNAVFRYSSGYSLNKTRSSNRFISVRICSFCFCDCLFSLQAHSSYPMASLMPSLTKHSHYPSGLSSHSYSSLNIQVLQRQRPQYFFLRSSLWLSFFFISWMTLSSFSQTRRISEWRVRWGLSCSRFCQIRRTNTSRDELSSMFFLLHWISSKKNTQLTIFFCSLLSLFAFDSDTPSSLLALGEVTGETISSAFIYLKVGLHYGSRCSILERILWVFLDIAMSLGKDRGFFAIQLESELMDLENQGQNPTKLSQATTPSDQTSALSEYYCPCSTSGAIQAGLPMKLEVVSPLSNSRLNPQSATLILPCWKRMLAGLMSRWMMLCC